MTAGDIPATDQQLITRIQAGSPRRPAPWLKATPVTIATALPLDADFFVKHFVSNPVLPPCCGPFESW